MVASRRGELDAVRGLRCRELGLRAGCVGNGEQVLEGAALVPVGHVARPCHTHQKCAAFGHGFLNGVEIAAREGAGGDVAKNDDVEALPFRGDLRQGGGLGLAKGARGARINQGRLRAAMNRVGMKEDVLEVDGLVPPVEEVAQVAKFPAGKSIDEEDVRAVVGDGDLEVPGVVLLKDLAGIGLQADAVVLNALVLGQVGKVDLGPEADVCDLDLDGLNDVLPGEKLGFHLLTAEPVELRGGGDDDLVVEIDRLGSVEGKQRDIDRTHVRADGDGGERRVAHGELAQAVLGKNGAIMTAVA